MIDETAEKASLTSSNGANNGLNIADKVRGIQKRISRLRSRSVERLSQRHRVVVDEEEIGAKDVDDEIDQVQFTIDRQAEIAALYKGPFMGKAKALVDFTPSPYDRDGLKFKRGDIIDVIAMNPSGLWKGKTGGRLGNFKFINVELIVENENNLDTYSRPKSVEEILKRLKLDKHLSVFVLNGFEDLESFARIDSDDLDYLGVNEKRQAILSEAAKLLLSLDNEDKADTSSGSSPRDSGCFAGSAENLSQVQSLNNLTLRPRAAQTRATRDRRVVTAEVIQQPDGLKRFEQLVEKYSTNSNSNSSHRCKERIPNFEFQFRNARSVFEQRK